MSLFWSNWSNWNNFAQTHSTPAQTLSAGFDYHSADVDEQTATALGTVLIQDTPQYTWSEDANGNTIPGSYQVHDATPVLFLSIRDPLAEETLGFDTAKLSGLGLSLVGNQIYSGDTLILTLTETVQNGHIVAITAVIPPLANNQALAVAALSSVTYQYLGDNPPTDHTRFVDVRWDSWGSASARAINLHNINDAPVLIGSQAAPTHGFEDISYVVHASDLVTGFADPEGDSLAVTGVSSDHGTVTDNGDGTYTLTGDSHYSGVVTLSYSLDDGHGGVTAATLALTLDAATVGGADGDVLDPGTGAQAMFGLGGDDTYIVDDAGDVVTEKPNDGNDTVQAACPMF